MHVLIVGCGRVGSGLARDLVTQGFDVAIIDESPEAFHPVSYTHLTLPTNREV